MTRQKLSIDEGLKYKEQLVREWDITKDFICKNWLLLTENLIVFSCSFLMNLRHTLYNKISKIQLIGALMGRRASIALLNSVSAAEITPSVEIVKPQVETKDKVSSQPKAAISAPDIKNNMLK